MLIRRILMNAQDTSPGTGAPSTSATPAPAPAGTPAPQNAPAPQPAPAPQGAAVDVAAITKSITDGVFASLRRAGVLNDAKPKPPTGGDTPTATTTGSNGISASDVQSMIEQASAITRVSVEYGLQPDAEASLKKLIAVEKPDDPLMWGRSFAESMGLKRGATAPVTAVTSAPTITITNSTAAPAANPAPVPAPQPATANPVTDRGSPPPSTRPLEERSLYDMSEADRQEYISRHGPTKYAQKLMSDGKGRRTLLG